MAKSTKSYEERMLEMEKKEQESLEKAMKGMKNSSPLPLHFLHIGIGFFLHCL